VPKKSYSWRTRTGSKTIKEARDGSGVPVQMCLVKKYSKAVPAFAALLTLLLAGIVTPRLFARTTSLHCQSFAAVAAHNQRPKFDSDRWNWSGPVAVFQPLPPETQTADAAFPVQISFSRQVKGFRYNRPPPIL
jgi:hypothetical protein